MANFNKVMLMGNLTRDPELRYTQSGSALVKFGLATNRRYRSKASKEMVEETCFVDIEGWGQQAETFSQYMSKGRPVFIEGRLRLDSWETKEGQKRSRLVVVMEGFQFLGQGGRGGGEGGEGGGGGEMKARSAAGRPGKVAEAGGGQPAEDYDFDDIPF
ncbi:MAG: single-stranded DNA-binding protein [Planctomycetota bacterium]|nr:single-stranded DNA-binding protein [Planctomycetota bacterium]